MQSSCQEVGKGLFGRCLVGEAGFFTPKLWEIVQFDKYVSNVLKPPAKNGCNMIQPFKVKGLTCPLAASKT